MIKYNDVLKKLSENGWSSYRLKEEAVIHSGTIDRLRTGMPITTETIDVICRLCKCQPGDFLTWVPDEEEYE